jgi:hypothetical protein
LIHAHPHADLPTPDVSTILYGRYDHVRSSSLCGIVWGVALRATRVPVLGVGEENHWFRARRFVVALGCALMGPHDHRPPDDEFFSGGSLDRR